MVQLPFGSIAMINDVRDPTRQNTRGVMHRMQLREEDTQLWLKAPYPQPWNYTYQIDLWCRTYKQKSHLSNQIAMWLREGGYFYLDVDHGEGYGEIKKVFTRFMGAAEKDNREPDDKDRVIQKSFTFQVEGWRVETPQPYYVIEEVNVRIWNQDQTELYDTVSVQEE